MGQVHRRPPREQVAELSGGRLHRTGPGTKTFRDFYFTAGKKTFSEFVFLFFREKIVEFRIFLQISIFEDVDKKIRNCFFLLSSSLQSRWRRDTGEEKMIRARKSDPVSSTIEKKQGSKKLWRKKTKKKNQSEAFLVTNKGEPKWATREERKVHCSSLFQKDAAH